MQAQVERDGSLRVAAARIGVSHITLWKFLAKRGDLRPTTVAAMREWLDRPGDADAAQELRKNLRRVLGGLRKQDRAEAEKEIGRVIERFFRRAGKPIPQWVRNMGARTGK